MEATREASWTVFVSPRGWGLPTVDPPCLAALAWFKFNAVPHTTRECDTALSAPNEELPFAALPAGGGLVAARDLFEHVARRAPSPLTQELSAAQRAEAAAYTSLIQHSLRTAWLYTLWYDVDNFASTARKVYGQRLPFPLDYVVPWMSRQQVADQLSVGRPVLDRDEVFDHASEAVASLAELVATRPYCFGDKPSELDAWLYGYLAVILHAPLPVSELQQLVQSYEPLVKYTARIHREFFVK